MGRLGIKVGTNAVLSGFKTANGVIICWISEIISFLSTGSIFLINGVQALILDFG